MKDLPAPKWTLNELKHTDIYDGDEYLVAFRVVNKLKKTEDWIFEKIRICCDEDFFNMHYYDCCNEIYDEWSWEDFEYYIKL